MKINLPSFGIQIPIWDHYTCRKIIWFLRDRRNNVHMTIVLSFDHCISSLINIWHLMADDSGLTYRRRNSCMNDPSVQAILHNSIPYVLKLGYRSNVCSFLGRLYLFAIHFLSYFSYILLVLIRWSMMYPDSPELDHPVNKTMVL